MKTISGKEFAKLLEKKNWILKRIKGSHHIYVKENNPVRISLPMHGSISYKTGLLKHFMKIAGIEENEL
ncbi:MAG: type II toxin-antitoxin system HicA family toxin [Bacteroidetes bacterium]|nr:type II toxin-antitoxin system HicA family toxin [Bacteroidota bacterium]